jgi:hypothetical protein
MDTHVLFGLEPMNLTIRSHKVTKEGSIVTLFSKSGRPFARIALSASESPRGAMWLKDTLAGEFWYRRRWYLYPIEKGQVSPTALSIDPVSYLIKRYEERMRSSGVTA